MNKVTLKEVLGWKTTGLSPEQWKELENRPCHQAIREKITTQGNTRVWRSARNEIASKTSELLNISLLDISRRVWNKSRELAKYRDPEKYPPNTTSMVELVEHKISSTHRPYVEVRLAGEKIGRIDFEVKVELTFKGLRLHIQNGRIKSIDAGECLASGTLHCEGFLLAQQESKKVQLSETIDLGEGIEL